MHSIVSITTPQLITDAVPRLSFLHHTIAINRLINSPTSGTSKHHLIKSAGRANLLAYLGRSTFLTTSPAITAI